MKIAVLTSSRADYGIYLPLLINLKNDAYFDLSIIAFGSHLSEKFGYTLNNILKDGFKVDYQLSTIPKGDSPHDISQSIGNTIKKFSDFWNENHSNFELVFCLGDRYEMYAAVVAGIPFQIRFAHIHGGEVTLGAIDNIFRHSISHASIFHFTAAKVFSNKLTKMLDSPEHVYTVGSLSLDGIYNLELFSINEFITKFNVNLAIPTILFTFHPETVNYSQSEQQIDTIISSLEQLKKYNILITLPNADTSGMLIRSKLIQYQNSNKKRIKCFENLGKKGYFSAMKHCSFLLGNTSSGIIEAASFKKMVVNIGQRQEGRYHSDNVLNVPFNKLEILEAVKKIEKNPVYYGHNPYYSNNTSKSILEIIKKIQFNNS